MLHATRLSSPRLMAAATLILPACGTLVARMLLPDAAAHAAGGSPRATSADGAFVPPDTTWVRALTLPSGAQEIKGSPFFLPEIQDIEAEEQISEPQAFVEPPPEASPPPTVRVSAIMRTASGQIAMIDGKAATVGARIVADWLLAAIDEQRRTITLQNESDGREVVVALDPPF